MSSFGDIRLATERLHLNSLSSDQAEKVYQYQVNNREFLQPWEPLRDDHYYTIEEQKRILDNQTNANRNGTSLSLWIFLKNSNAEEDSFSQIPIGNINFSNIIRGPFLSCYLGYKLDHQHLSKGYTTEAITAGIQYLFNEQLLHRIEANVMPKNTASIRVLEKLGFEQEGIAPKYLKINGKWEDHIHYSLRNQALEEEEVQISQ